MRKPPPPPVVHENTDNDFETVSSALERLSVRANVTSSIRTTQTTENAPINAIFSDAKKEAASCMLYFASEVPEPDSLVDKDSLEQTSITTSSTVTGSSEIQDQIRATQLRRLNREMTPTISDVYHERNIGLGLAPSLSKLLLPVAEEKSGGSGSAVSKVADAIGKDWLSPAILQQFGNETSTSPYTDLSRRDEGDGRSIADSQCSTGSYTKKDNVNGGPPQEDLKQQPPVPRARASRKNYPPPPIPKSRGNVVPAASTDS